MGFLGSGGSPRAGREKDEEVDEMELTGDSPEWPPPRVWRKVDRAAEQYERLAAQDRQLHFEIDPATGDLVIALRDLEGRELRRLHPSDALDAAEGRLAQAPRGTRLKLGFAQQRLRKVPRRDTVRLLREADLSPRWGYEA